MALVWKIVSLATWRGCGAVVPWSDDDRHDGFMHLSTSAQVLETANRHFQGREGLVALEIDEAGLGGALRYEKSRGGALFPHLYGQLPRTAVLRARALVVDDEGKFRLAAGDGGV